MPGIIGNCERVASIWRKWHLSLLRFPSIGKHFVKDGANVWRRVVRRQVELHRDAFPEAVGVFEDAISWNVARQDRHRVHSHLCKVYAESAFQARREPLHERFLQLFRTKHTAGHVPDSAFPWRQMADVLG